jgi:hypothetical protein
MVKPVRKSTTTVFFPFIGHETNKAQRCLGAGATEDTHVKLGTSWHRSWGLYVWWNYNRYGVPCVWGEYLVDQAIQIGIGGNSPYVLGFNEPDREDQANLTPLEAAPLWHTLTEAHTERLFASPAIVESDTWLTDFRTEYIGMYGEPPRMDVIDIHCYADDPVSDLARVDYALARASDWAINEVWVSEFQYGHRQEQGAADRLVEFFDGLESRLPVTKIFWFSVHIPSPLPPWYPSDWLAPNLIDTDGELTELGQVYSSL